MTPLPKSSTKRADVRQSLALTIAQPDAALAPVPEDTVSRHAEHAMAES